MVIEADLGERDKMMAAKLQRFEVNSIAERPPVCRTGACAHPEANFGTKNITER